MIGYSLIRPRMRKDIILKHCWNYIVSNLHGNLQNELAVSVRDLLHIKLQPSIFPICILLEEMPKNVKLKDVTTKVRSSYSDNSLSRWKSLQQLTCT